MSILFDYYFLWCEISIQKQMTETYLSYCFNCFFVYFKKKMVLKWYDNEQVKCVIKVIKDPGKSSCGKYEYHGRSFAAYPTVVFLPKLIKKKPRQWLLSWQVRTSLRVFVCCAGLDLTSEVPTTTLFVAFFFKNAYSLSFACSLAIARSNLNKLFIYLFIYFPSSP